MPDLSHLWQRFMLTSSLLVGLAVGAAATIFGYSNLGTVNVRWSVFHIDSVPLWAVAVIPLALVLIAGTLYHWVDGLHHFTEHMRHRHRVHELEVEVTSLRAHLDQVLEMPDHSTSKVLPKRPAVSLPAADEGLSELAPSEPEVVAVPEKAEPVATDAIVEDKPSPEPETVKDNGAGKAKTPRVRGSWRRRATPAPAPAVAPAAATGKDEDSDKTLKAAEATAEGDPPTLGV